MPAPVEAAPYRRSSYSSSWKQEISLDFYDFHTMSYPSVDDFLVENHYPHELEATFCRDFSCCGLVLDDLHDLLQHYEECHVRLDIEEEDSQMSFFNDDWSSDSSVPTSPRTPSKPAQGYSNGNKDLLKKAMASISDIYSEDIGVSLNDSSAFDTSVLRVSPNTKNPKKRNLAQYTDASPDITTPNAKKAALPTTKPSLADPCNVVSDNDFLENSTGLFSPPSTPSTNTVDKPYKCSVPGCDKAYKNPNGLKYHNRHGHCNSQANGDTDKASLKPYQCSFGGCGKRYKNLNGLKYHIEHAHVTILSTSFNVAMPSTPAMVSPAPSPVPSPYMLPLTSSFN